MHACNSTDAEEGCTERTATVATVLDRTGPRQGTNIKKDYDDCRSLGLTNAAGCHQIAFGYGLHTGPGLTFKDVFDLLNLLTLPLALGIPGLGEADLDLAGVDIVLGGVVETANGVVAVTTLEDVARLVPNGETLSSWGARIWGVGESGAKVLIGTRSAEELSAIPGLNVESATVLRNFYRGAAAAGKGGATAPVRVELLNDVIRRLGGTP